MWLSMIASRDTPAGYEARRKPAILSMTKVAPILLSAYLLATAPVFARANDSCLPEFTSLDGFQEASASSFSLPLKSHNVSGPFVTHATLEGQWDGSALSLTFQFKVDGVSLPYNIFAVMIVSDKDVLAWHDLTNSCTGPGKGIFPGQSYALPAVKTSTAPRAGWHIIVWGRL
jgi:hypothetical protein